MKTFLALIGFAFLSSCTCTQYGYRIARRPVSPASLTDSSSAPVPLIYSASAPAPITFSASAPAPLTYSAPAPLPVEISQPNYKSESYSAPGVSRTELRDDHGQYSLSYITATGIRVRERGYLKSAKEGYIPVKEGSYEYTSPEGTPVSYSYKADENGFNIKGFPFPLGPVQS